MLRVNGKSVLCGTRTINGTLFKAAIIPVLQDITVNKAIADNSLIQLYDERWGHQDKRHVKEMFEKELGINVKLGRDLCESCVYGKSHRLPFGTREKANASGELISTDIVGPLHESFSKKRYFIEFKDSFTKIRYDCFIREKSLTKDILMQVIRHAEKQGHSIKGLLRDGGGEFDNNVVRNILQEHGITLRLTAPYTPEQNGASERDNRSVVEMARIFKYSNPEVVFPKAIWTEAMSTAVYVLNRTGKSSVVGKSPYEL